MTAIDDAARPSTLRRIFDNRLARFFTLFVVVMAADVGCWAIPDKLKPFVPEASRGDFLVITGVIGALAMLAIYALFVRLMEHRGVRELRPSAIPGAVAGFAMGAGLFALVIAIMWQMGFAHVESTPGEPLASAVNMAILTGVGEELVFRGVIFRIFEEMFGTLTALVVSSGLFGLAHLGNPGATLTSGIAIMLEAGLLLGAAYMLTGSLWMAMGLHAGWNFVQGGVFGGEVSGQKFHGLLHTTFSGPELWSGGKFGAEGSMVAVAVCTTAALVILVAAIRRGAWKKLHLTINDRR